MTDRYRPDMTDSGLGFSLPAVAIDERGESQIIELVGENIEFDSIRYPSVREVSRKFNSAS